MTERFDTTSQDQVDAWLLRTNKGLSAVATVAFLVTLFTGVARLEVARYAFWAWAASVVLTLVALLATKVAVRRGAATRKALEPREPSDLVAEVWEAAVVVRPPVAEIVEKTPAGEWRTARIANGRTVSYRIRKP